MKPLIVAGMAGQPHPSLDSRFPALFGLDTHTFNQLFDIRSLFPFELGMHDWSDHYAKQHIPNIQQQYRPFVILAGEPIIRVFGYENYPMFNWVVPSVATWTNRIMPIFYPGDNKYKNNPKAIESIRWAKDIAFTNFMGR